MLHLHVATPERWVVSALANTEELLIDHAHCEKKAAGVAMNLLFSYVENQALAREMTTIVREELEHFNMVLDLLQQRDVALRKIPPAAYGRLLHEQINKLEPARTVDRLLVAGLIEARSCERFGLLSERLPDKKLAGFYGSLFESEARHHATYTRLAMQYADEDFVRARLAELSRIEGEIILQGESRIRMHS